MLQEDGSLLRQYGGRASLAAAALLLVANTAFAAGDNQGGRGKEAGSDRAVRLLEVIPVPVNPTNASGGLYSFDISWVDQHTQTYYLADRSNTGVDIVDAANGTFRTRINATPSFAGFTGATNTSGPNGVTTGGHCLFVTDTSTSPTSGRVVSFNTSSFPPTQVSSVSTGGIHRADELAFASGPSLLLVINNEEAPSPFGTFIKVNQTTCALTPPTLADRLTLDAAHVPGGATNGAEQPVWDPTTQRFYLSIPQIGPTVSHGGVVKIKPGDTGPVQAVFPIEYCGPAGLTVGPKGDLFVGCNTVFDTAGNVWDPNGTVTAAPQGVIIDANTGAIDAHVYGVGAGDEVWFNSGDGNYYVTGSGSPFRPIDTGGASDAKGATPLGVVDASDGKILQLVTTYNVPAKTTPPTHPAGTAHSVAANAENNLIFVPLAANNAFSAFAVPGGGPVDDCHTGCIAVFGHPDEDQNPSR